MTAAETLAYNAGIRDVLGIAERTAASIAATSKRPLAESFAVAALQELADAGRGLLIKPGDARHDGTRPAQNQAAAK